MIKKRQTHLTDILKVVCTFPGWFPAFQSLVFGWLVWRSRSFLSCSPSRYMSRVWPKPFAGTSKTDRVTLA
jgi:hypothetical protein